MSKTMNERLKRTSKFLSLVLRHDPDVIGVTMDEEGWVSIDELIRQANKHGRALDVKLIEDVVRENDKQRFSISAERGAIRANQGHSIRNVELGLVACQPPSQLLHGTIAKFIDSIRQQGLLRRSRNHVHLSKDRATAERVALRRGAPVILVVDAAGMQRAGYEFFLSDNNVWLTHQVPVEYIEFPNE